MSRLPTPPVMAPSGDENEAGSGADLDLELAQANFLRDFISHFPPLTSIFSVELY